MHWLPLKMYENYLLQPEAIAQVLNELMGEAGQSVTSEGVLAWLVTHGNEAKYFDRDAAVPHGDPQWIKQVHGAKLLGDLFFYFTQESGAHEYDKVRHGLLLTRYLVLHPTQDLIELAALLGRLLDQ